MRVLACVGVDVEARALARHLGLAPVSGRGWPHFRAGAIEVVCVGPGARHLGARLETAAPCDLVASAGACGALAPHLSAGDLVVPEVVATPDGPDVPTASVPALRRAGRLLTVPAVVDTPAAKARLRIATGAEAVDMESAPVLAWAAARGLPALAVRGVADEAARAVPSELAALVGDDGRVRAAGALGLALRRPARIAPALALGRATAAALRTVAAALGRLAGEGR